MTLYGQSEDGRTVQVTVKSFDEDNVEIDYNHPLAGKDLIFDVEVIEVRDATANELLSGYVSNDDHCHSGGCGCS